MNPQMARRVLVAEYRVDLRKSHDGLLAEARRHGLCPWQGDVIVFAGRCRRKIKVLYADSTGLWVSYKKFSGGSMKTKLKFLDEPNVNEISTAELAMLLEGNKFDMVAKSKTWLPT